MVVEQNAQLLRSKNEKLEKLCRALQAERNQLRQKEKLVRPADSAWHFSSHTHTHTHTHSRKEEERNIKRLSLIHI